MIKLGINLIKFARLFKSIVQGSQKLYVRVAISQKFDEVLFQFPTRIIAKIVVENTTVVAFLVDFVCKPHLFSEVWPASEQSCALDRKRPYVTCACPLHMRQQCIK